MTVVASDTHRDDHRNVYRVSREIGTGRHAENRQCDVFLSSKNERSVIELFYPITLCQTELRIQMRRGSVSRTEKCLVKK